MSKNNISCGKISEVQAAGFLESQGYRILFRNYKVQGAEIDIIAREKDTICFIEVKSRSSDRFGSPQEAVTLAKQQKIVRAASMFLQENDLQDRSCRFDVVAIIRGAGKEKFSLIRGAFVSNE
ncbi:MAG: YraN family protein [Candidatus Omnitrophica bacterium]|nr:YraN family protein [Candidatus Omnitrophota bacterium]